MNLVEKKFSEAPYEIRMKVMPLYYILIALIGLAVFILFADVIGSFNIIDFLSHLPLLAITIVGFLMLRRGNYDFSSRFVFIILFVAMGLLRLLDGYEGYYSIPMLTSILCSFLILCSIFIGNQKIILILSLINAGSFLYLVILGIASGMLAESVETGVIIIAYTFVAQAATFIGSI